MEMDFRIEAEQRARQASFTSTTPVKRFSSRSYRLNSSELTPPRSVEDNETVQAAKLAEADYKWNGPRSRIPSGEFIPPRWQPDEEAMRCLACNSEFDWFNRRHHCRHCGNLFCGPCSSNTCLLPFTFGYRDPQRVCRACYTLLLPEQENLSRTIANHMCVNQIDVASEGCTIRRHANLPFTSSLNLDLSNAAYSVYNLFSVKYIRDKTIPLKLLSHAKAVVFLTVAKVGFFFCAKVGTGLAISRRPEALGGGWSAPCAFACLGLGYGFSIGAEVSDVVIVLTSDEAVSTLATGTQATLGAEIEVAVGALGRSGGAEMMLSTEGLAPAVSFSHSKGFFVGASLEGAVLTPRHEVNQRFYGRSVTPQDLLLRHSIPPPRAAAPLYTALAEAASQAPGLRHCTDSPPISRHHYYTHSPVNSQLLATPGQDPAAYRPETGEGERLAVRIPRGSSSEEENEMEILTGYPRKPPN